MAKKKTRVLLPGGIQGLVHDLQNGTSNFAPKAIVEQSPVGDDDEKDVDNNADTPSQPSVTETPVAVAEDRENIEVQPVGKVEEPVTVTPQAVSPTKREDIGIEVVSPAAPVSVAPVSPADGRGTESDETHGRGRKPKENTMKEYHIVKDDSTDSWQLFIDMAQQYKSGGGKLATIYIDESLKSVLDRMKYAGTEKLSTSAILSSIVARFIYDHEDDIRKVLFSGNLI